MWFKVDTGRGVPIYLQLIEQVRRAAAAGVLAPGEQLPSVRDLAVQLSVNPNTIAKAYQEMEREGVVKTLRGRGTFMTAPTALLAEQERQRQLEQALERLLVEAYHLGFSREKVLSFIKERLGKGEVGGNGARDE
ncbi:MAG: GntR family transcriptional regulator [Peptococcaceae bacterium]|nr:GntR family transcriptional regulator [Peptococcaceae bacterium]